ncbi:MAG: tryptophan synthase subunit beta [Denitrovibrio sp.]|nr:MAG: tryptophan synthase subunit beta [Denitrovibrio sp.]
MYDKMFYGRYGGQFAAETLIPALDDLEAKFEILKDDEQFNKELQHLFKAYAGRPTPMYKAENLSEKYGCEIYLKREDLLHTGAHKLNNTLGQALLTKYMGKKRVIAETGAGQHGVATATVAALFGMECTVYMGAVDVARQEPNVKRMELLGAKVVPVTEGQGTLKEATNAAMREWVSCVQDTHYIIGSVVGPYPFPKVVTHFQEVIGDESREQCKELDMTPDSVVACVGGGSNAIGIFNGFLDQHVELYGVEAGGTSDDDCKHARTLGKGKPGILHGAYTYLVQTPEHQISDVHSISAGLDYPGIGPVHSMLHDVCRVKYGYVRDNQALNAFKELSRLEGIIPALESSHALAYVLDNPEIFKGKKVLVNLSGRGDKDMASILERGLI